MHSGCPGRLEGVQRRKVRLEAGLVRVSKRSDEYYRDHACWINQLRVAAHYFGASGRIYREQTGMLTDRISIGHAGHIVRNRPWGVFLCPSLEFRW